MTRSRSAIDERCAERVLTHHPQALNEEFLHSTRNHQGPDSQEKFLSQNTFIPVIASFLDMSELLIDLGRVLRHSTPMEFLPLVSALAAVVGLLVGLTGVGAGALMTPILIVGFGVSPLIIHARAADEDMAEILSSEYRNAPFNCVMHCFSSSPELGRAALDLGFYLSMSGIATFPKSQEVRDIFASAPLDRILVETDAPYLAPPPFRGKRNEPAYTAFTAQVGADVFGLSLSEFAAQTEANFERLFWKAA